MRNYTRRRSNEGFSLIEVLIALIVLSIGLIGTAALTVSSLQNVHSALHSSLAATIALDYEERLWLAVADIPSGCPEEGDGGVLGELITHWSSGGTGFLRLPTDFEFTSGVAGGTGRTLLVPLSISWSESRFIGTDGEVFSYTAAVHCRNS